MNQNSLLILMVLLAQLGFCQNDKNLRGQIMVKNAMVGGVHVLNLVNEKEALTNDKGEFTIAAKPDDVLIFSAVHLDYMRKIIDDHDFESGFFTVEMTAKINELDEVRVSNIRMDAVSMGILARPAKNYTPAERHLRTATALYPTVSMGSMMGAAISVDPLINWISGRTKLLKSELQVERKEILLQKLAGLYPEDYYLEKLKIPKDYIKAFQYYAVADPKLAQALLSKNKFTTTFLIGGLAADYKNLLQNEKN